MRKSILLLFVVYLNAQYLTGWGVRTFTPSEEVRFAPVALSTSFGVDTGYTTIDLTSSFYLPLSDKTGLSVVVPVKADRGRESTRAAPGPFRIGVSCSFPTDKFGVLPFFQWSNERKMGYTRLFSSGTPEYGILLYFKDKLRSFNIALNVGAVSFYNYENASYYGNFLPLRFLLKKRGKISPFIELSYDWFILRDFSLGPFKRDTNNFYSNSPLTTSFGFSYELGQVELKGGISMKFSRYSGDSASYYPNGKPGFEVFGGVVLNEIGFSLRKREGGFIRGVVLSKEGQPLKARIFVEGPDTLVETNEEGGFEIKLKPGIYRISIEADGYKKEMRIVGVTSNSSEEFTFYLSGRRILRKKIKRALLIVEVETENGLPLNADVVVDDIQKMGPRTVFELVGGKHSLQVDYPGYSSFGRTFELNEGDTLKVKAVLSLKPIELPVVYFGADSYEVSEDELPKLKEVADFLKTHGGYILIITGYASSDGNDDYNLILSERRAAEVKRLLVEVYGVDARRIKDRGAGELEDEEPGKARRVEFTLIKG